MKRYKVWFSVLALLCALITGAAAETNTLTLPANLKVIGEEAFMNDGSLDAVVVPEGVSVIGARAFAGSSVSKLVLPGSLTSIAKDAFAGCTGLVIAAPEDSYAAEWAELMGYTVDTLEETPAEDFTYTISDGKCTITGYKGSGGKIRIPERIEGAVVTAIGDNAFNNKDGLTNIALPDGLQSIGSSAFRYCRGLTGISIPGSVTSIGSSAFEYCDSLTCASLNEGLESIGSWAFCGCPKLLRLEVPDSVTSIGSGFISGDTGLTYLSLGGGLDAITESQTYISSRTSDPSASALETLVVKSGVRELGKSAFSGFTNLKRVSLPDTLSVIGELSFSSCTALDGVILPDGLQSIGSNAFRYCRGLTGISIPGSVTSIGSSAFEYCDSLTCASLNEGLESIGSWAFCGCPKLLRLEVPDSVTSIGSGFISGDTGLAYLSFGGGLDAIAESQTYISSRTSHPSASALETLVIKSGVRELGKSAFSGFTNLKRVSLPDTLSVIGDFSFSSCTALDGVILPDGLQSIGSSAFRYCRGLTGISIPGSVTSIGSSAFEYCDSLAYASLNEGLESIDSWAFSGCPKLASVILPDGITYVGSNIAFDPTILVCTRGSVTEYTLKEAKYKYTYRVSVPSVEIPVVPNDITDEIQEVTDDPSPAEEDREAEIVAAIKKIGRDNLIEQLNHVPLRVSDLTSYYYVDNMNLFEEFIDLLERIVNGKLSDLALSPEKKQQYLFYQALEFMASDKVTTFEKQNLKDSWLADLSEGAGSTVDAFCQYLEDMTTLTGVESAVVDRDIFGDILSKYASGDLTDADAVNRLTELLRGTALEGRISEVFGCMQSFDRIQLFIKEFKYLNNASMIVDRVKEGVNQFMLLDAIDSDSMLRVAEIYMNSDDIVVRGVGEKLRTLARANDAQRIAMIASGQLVDYGLDELAKAISKKAVSPNLAIDIAAFVTNAFTDVDKLAGLKDKMEWSVSAATTAYQNFEAAKKRFDATQSDEDLMAAYQAMTVYMGTAYQSESSLLKLYETVSESAIGGIVIREDYREMMEQVRGIIAYFKKSVKTSTLYATAWQNGDLEELQAMLKELQATGNETE